MLVLMRHRGEWIDVGPDIRIVVVEIRGDRVRLGIQAPPEIPIYRREIKELRAAEKLVDPDGEEEDEEEDDEWDDDEEDW